jgi:hypothetical protein
LVHGFSYITFIFHETPFSYTFQAFCPVLRLKAAASQKLPPILTVAWAVESVAFLGGYLEHRRKTPLGIQVLWRGWLKLHDLCQGWQLAIRT